MGSGFPGRPVTHEAEGRSIGWQEQVYPGDRGNLAATAHHHSLSSLLSMARRCSREQRSQNQVWRPRSVAEVQVSGGGSLSAVAPQKEQLTMRATYAAAATTARAGRRGRPPAGSERDVGPGRWLLSRDQSDGRSDGTGQGESCLCSGTLGLAGQAPGGGQLVLPSRRARLLQARGYVRSRQVFLNQVHCIAPIKGLVHVLVCLLSPGHSPDGDYAATSFLRGRPRGRLRGITTP